MKKILLLGEYSGLHTNLKKGLEELGHKVVLASDGDGKKGIHGDISLKLERDNKISKFFELNKIINEFNGFDIVQLINPYITPNKYITLFYDKIFKSNQKVYCLAAGDDYFYSEAVLRQAFQKYTPFDNDLLKGEELPYHTKLDYILQKRVLNKVDGIIPIMYEYAHSYRNSIFASKTMKTIPLPIDVSNIVYTENIVREGKIVFYHGITRPEFKGTSYITEAMKLAKEKYPNDIEIIISPVLPLKEYLKMINRVNVVIDQCRSYSYGMNAVYSMAMGKVVMSGCEHECLEELDFIESEIINIQPNVNQILNQIEKLIEQKDEILEIGKNNRKFAESHHSHKEIAKKFLESWQPIQ
ncbi:hypothetical protein NLX67_03115 [Domibacillus sp. A3M-37]|uniref:glycosyltransferase n=1 Tax=Domibacillus sp. A3M-37 TaxID=2962037 RepID=UPI0020B66D35|nr:glycosyltransferase [Domibacillus sp. A3M-37]MCP3761380.1 hypothetical protein [Domibacillus sp. A3M-37]